MPAASVAARTAQRGAVTSGTKARTRTFRVFSAIKTTATASTISPATRRTRNARAT